MKKCNAEPLNMIGMNIPSVYGGILSEKYWESKQDDKIYERQNSRKLLKDQGFDVTWCSSYETSSNDEEEFKDIQRYDDDKMELMGATDKINFTFFNMS